MSICTFLDRSWFSFSFILCLLSCIDSEDDDDVPVVFSLSLSLSLVRSLSLSRFLSLSLYLYISLSLSFSLSPSLSLFLSAVPRWAIAVAEDMPEVSLIINVQFLIVYCNLGQLWFVLTMFGCHFVDGFPSSVGWCSKKALFCKVKWFTALVTDCTLLLL